MNTISAGWSSLILCSRRLASQLLIAILVLPLTTLACGPEYNYWYAIEHRVPFDPSRPSKGDSSLLFHQLFPRYEYWRNRNEVDPELAALQTALDSSTSRNRPALFYMTPESRSRYASEYCFASKYEDLRDTSVKLSSYIMRRMSWAEFGKTRPSQLAPVGYIPGYDLIPDPGEKDFAANLRNQYQGPADRYSSYFTSVAYIFSDLSTCIPDESWAVYRPFAEQILNEMQQIPEYATPAGIALLMGYIDGGRPDEARHMLDRLSSEVDELLSTSGVLAEQVYSSDPTADEFRLLLAQYEQVLRDDAIQNPPRLIALFDSGGYAWGACESNSYISASAFALAVVDNTTLSDAEVVELLTYRKQLLSNCHTVEGRAAFIDTLRANLHSPYHRYLLAAGLFYAGDNAEALEIFSDLSNLKNVPWLSETSLYLSARTQLRGSQTDWSGRERDDTIDVQMALDSAKSFLRYVADYPDGRYAKSANGLLRRAHWLRRDEAVYQELLSQAVADFLLATQENPTWTEAEKQELAALFNEFRRLGQFDDDTNGLSVISAFVADAPVSGAEKYRPFTRTKSIVSANDAFLKEDYDSVVEQYEGEAGLNQFELMLLTRAYEQLGQIDAALDILQTDMPDTLQPEIDYEVAILLHQHYGVERVVLDEKLANINIKRVYLASLCDGSLQEELLDKGLSRDVQHAVFVDLALRYLYADQFQLLHELMQAYPDDVLGEYAAIRTAVNQIANNQDPGTGYMNIAYFLQGKVSSPIYGVGTDLTQEASSACRQNIVNSSANGPYYYFNRSLEFFDENDRSESEEKSLYGLTMCFKNGASCRWGESPANGLSSKVAFDRLHTRYKDGKWAGKAKYYY